MTNKEAIDRDSHPENAAACILGAWERQNEAQKVEFQKSGRPLEFWKKRHAEAWEGARKVFSGSSGPHDRAFRKCVELIVCTLDDCRGVDDYLIKPYIVELFGLAKQLLDFIDQLDGGRCDQLLRSLASGEGLLKTVGFN